MTSNQLSYWKLKEDERSNLAREAETQRSNLENEKIKTIANELNAKGLELKRGEDILKLYGLVNEYGNLSSSQLPTDVQHELGNALGIDWDTSKGDTGNKIATWWDEVKRVVKGLGGGKGLASIASLF